MTTKEAIEAECDALKAMLVDKNAAYGDSATNPVRVFSSADPVEQLRVRIDDKLSRIVRGGMTMADGRDEDVVLDLLGYLVLYRIAMKRGAQAAIGCPICDVVAKIEGTACSRHPYAKSGEAVRRLGIDVPRWAADIRKKVAAVADSLPMSDAEEKLAVEAVRKAQEKAEAHSRQQREATEKLMADPARYKEQKPGPGVADLIAFEQTVGGTDAATLAFDAIAAAVGCPRWEYPGQLVRDVQALASIVSDCRSFAQEGTMATLHTEEVRKIQRMMQAIETSLDRAAADRSLLERANDEVRREVIAARTERDSLNVRLRDALGREVVAEERIAYWNKEVALMMAEIDAARAEHDGACAEIRHIEEKLRKARERLNQLLDATWWAEELARHDTLSLDSAEDRATLARDLAAAVERAGR